MKVKELTQHRPAPGTGGHWYMGHAYMRAIGKADAARVLMPHPLPRIGYETTAHTARDGRGDRHTLYVQNVSGLFFLSCCSASVDTWPALFGVEVTE